MPSLPYFTGIFLMEKNDNIQESLWVLQGTGSILTQGIITVGIFFISSTAGKVCLKHKLLKKINKTQTLIITVMVEFWVIWISLLFFNSRDRKMLKKSGVRERVRWDILAQGSPFFLRDISQVSDSNPTQDMSATGVIVKEAKRQVTLGNTQGIGFDWLNKCPGSVFLFVCRIKGANIFWITNR